MVGVPICAKLGQHQRPCDAVIPASISTQRSDAHCTVRVRALLVPPLVQPTSPTFPLGVITLMLNCPGPEITPVVSVICSCWLEFTVGPRGFPLITISDAETKLLPLTLSSTPCCT